MKKAYLFFILVLCSFAARAQDSSAVVTQVDCYQLSYYYSDLATFYYSKYDDDSVQYALKSWEDSCGLSEPILSFKVLYAIGNGTFTEGIYRGEVISYLSQYQNNMEGVGDNRPNVPDDYYPYLKSMAKSLQENKLPPLEKALVDFYATGDDEVLEKMDSTALAGTKLYEGYKAYKLRQYQLFGRFHFGIQLGAWIPDGKIDTIGSHPLIGFSLGSQWKKFSADLGLNIRFTNSPNYYDVNYYGSIVQTKYHAAIYIGLDMGYLLKEIRSHQFRALFGLGYDAITVVRSTDDEQYNGKFLSTVNFNGGLSYRYYLSRKQYIGLVGKYNLLFFRNKGATDLSGNAFTIGLAYGFH